MRTSTMARNRAAVPAKNAGRPGLPGGTENPARVGAISNGELDEQIAASVRSQDWSTEDLTGPCLEDSAET